MDLLPQFQKEIETIASGIVSSTGTNWDSLILNIKFDAEGIDYQLDSTINNEIIEGLDITEETCDIIEDTFGKIGDSRTLVMAGLSIADRLSEALGKIERLQDDLTSAQHSTRGALEQSRSEEKALAVKIDKAAERLERLASVLSEEQVA